MTACTKQPLEPIVPYVKQPEEVVPGRPLFFATAFTLGGYASPVLVESHLYRPTKIEGNDKHPASLGGTDIFSQASILGMYDPDRSQTVTYLGDIRSWGSLVEAMRAPLNIQKSLQGAGIMFTRTGIELLVGQQLTVNIRMVPATIQESVTVTGDAPLVDMTRSAVDTPVDPSQMADLPMNGRNWVDLPCWPRKPAERVDRRARHGWPAPGASALFS